jgi:hypothetical protein
MDVNFFLDRSKKDFCTVGLRVQCAEEGNEETVYILDFGVQNPVVRQPQRSPGICCRDLLPTRRPVAATSEEAG